MPRVTPRADEATDNGSVAEAQTPPAGPGPETPTAPAVPTEWNDEFRGLGGSYVVVDGKRVPQD